MPLKNGTHGSGSDTTYVGGEEEEEEEEEEMNSASLGWKRDETMSRWRACWLVGVVSANRAISVGYGSCDNWQPEREQFPRTRCGAHGMWEEELLRGEECDGEATSGEAVECASVSEVCLAEGERSGGCILLTT